MPDQLRLGLMLVDPPGRYDTLETWEQFLADLEKLPPSGTRNAAMASAREIIQQRGDGSDEGGAGRRGGR